MPEFPGRVRMPRLPSAPASPSPGEMYYDTATNILYWWNGTAWTSASGGSAAPEVFISTDAPAPRDQQVLWVDTDSIAPTPVGTPSSIPPLVTSLPALPGDGQEIYYLADAVNGVVWYLRYRAAASGSYKWEFLGGPAMKIEGIGGKDWNAAGETTQQINYNTLTTLGPSVIVPLAGEYDIEASAVGTCNVAGNLVGIYIWVTGDPAPGAPLPWNTGDAVTITAGAGYGNTLNARRTRTMTAGATAQILYAGSSAAGIYKYYNRNLYVTPRRVG